MNPHGYLQYLLQHIINNWSCGLLYNNHRRNMASLQLLLACTLQLLMLGNAVTVRIADIQNSNDDAVARHNTRFHTKDISFEGSHIQGVALHATDVDDDIHWSVAAPLAYALPNQGNVDGLLNEAALYEKIALFDRGENLSISEQIYSAQHAGAVAAVVVDFPDNHEKHTALLAAVKSDLDLWISLTIPSVIIGFKHGKRLLFFDAV
mmetsp:Transcript_9530/g.20657  ORF Transcript_9530/g.20657 Transcript_9530/m.20657 type:complete len:207 (-) Transcript_9530:2843-3463(-)